MNTRINPIAAVVIVLVAIGVAYFIYLRLDKGPSGQRPAGSMPPGVAAEFGRRMQGGMPQKPGAKSQPGQPSGTAAPGR